MKNMKVSKKLIVSFLLVAIMCAIVGIVGIYGMLQMDEASTSMYENQTVPLEYMSKLNEYLQRLRVNLREYIVGAALGDQSVIDSAHSKIEEFKPVMEENFDLYRATMTDPSIISVFEEARSLYSSSFLVCLDKTYELALTGDAQAAYAMMSQYTSDVNKVVDGLSECMTFKVNTASTTSDSTASMFRMLLILIIVVLVIAVSVAVFFALYLSGLISKPLVVLTAFMNKAGAEGDIVLTQEDSVTIGEYSNIKDEVGQCIASTAKFVSRLNDVGHALEQVAGGDLTAELALLSGKDTMGISLQKMVDNLNNMFGEINSATAQVSIGSKQIADGAQALAQGSTEQAASVEELSSSISEVAEKTRANAEMANRAANLANTIMSNAQTGSNQMDQMIEAVREINQASQNINSVIKSIEDIAFQTNILALNAAVEAARAGSAGKGFAVVAEEVRNLAAKSAEAAKDSGGLIASSIEKAELGVRIAGETAASLTEIVSGINESNQIVGNIATSSDEQSTAINEINRGIDQVAQVVQQNSATAQESAAASEEMSGQSNMLEELVAQFKLRDGHARSSLSGGARKSAGIPERSYEPAASSGYGLGKY